MYQYATQTRETSTISLHDALPISTSSWEKQQPSSRRSHPDGTVRADGRGEGELRGHPHGQAAGRDASGLLRLAQAATDGPGPDRKSTRLNSSHVAISYAVFCLKKT